MSSLRLIRCSLAATAAAAFVACSDKSPVDPVSVPEIPPAALIVSDPSVLTSGGIGQAAAISGEVAYVSVPSASLPNAVGVTIRNITAGAAQLPSISFSNGGFDPVSIVAREGDQLELTITGADGVNVYRTTVPKARPPRVVRTNPPKGATDVALNTRIIVVFTEPVAPATLTGATVKLLIGTESVPGSVHPVVGSPFEAEFIPDAELASGTVYRLVVTRGVRDTEGDSLEVEDATDFRTQSMPAAPVGPVSPVASIVSGFGHTCATRSDGKTLCWGDNWYGQLGVGNNLLAIGTCAAPDAGSVFLCSPAPVLVGGGQAFVSLAAGYEHACGLTSDGQAMCWGNNDTFPSIEDWPLRCDPATQQCGCNPSAGKCNGLPAAVGGGLKFESLVAGFWHTCGIRVGGGASCWGHELIVGGLGTGDGGVTSFPSPVRGDIDFKSLSSGGHHVCGLDASGTAYCWGLNLAGQLGFDGSENCKGPSTSNPAFVWRCAKAPTRVGGDLRFVALTAGWQHTCGLTAAGKAYCWGDYLFAGAYGATPQSVDGNLVFTSLSSGAAASHTCGVTVAKAVYCWGRNDFGQLGDGSRTSTLVPVRVAGDLAFSAVVAGDVHSCAITLAGEAYCWGGNRSGQLGTGTSSAGSLIPLRVAGQ